MKRVVLLLVVGVCLSIPHFSRAAVTYPLEKRVNEAFRAVWHHNPTQAENDYWRIRVVRREKTTFEGLLGAMYYHKALGETMGSAVAHARTASPAVAGMSAGKATSTQQMIVDVLPLFEKYIGNNPTNAEKAWWRKRISCGEITTEAALINSMKYHKAHGVRKGSDAICGGSASSSSSSSSSVGGGVVRKDIDGVDSHTLGNLVRIGIYGTGGDGTITVTSNGKYQVRDGNDTVSTVGKDDIVRVTFSGGKYHVRGAATVDGAGPIRLVPLSGAIMQITSYNDKSTTIAGKNYNRFRGIIEVRKCDGCNELWAINELRTEYYLRGLAETSGEGPEEYVKALGIAARTYVIYHHVVTGGRNEARHYDIGRTPDDQIYRGYEYEIITPRMSSIFNKVRGVIVTDGSMEEPVSTIYFSDSDGHTRSAKEVFHTDRFPHLQQSVKDPYHVASSCMGHCVGMSAQGAYGFAKAEGWSFAKILHYYYKGVKLVKAY